MKVRAGRTPQALYPIRPEEKLRPGEGRDFLRPCPDRCPRLEFSGEEGQEISRKQQLLLVSAQSSSQHSGPLSGPRLSSEQSPELWPSGPKHPSLSAQVTLVTPAWPSYHTLCCPRPWLARSLCPGQPHLCAPCSRTVFPGTAPLTSPQGLASMAVGPKAYLDQCPEQQQAEVWTRDLAAVLPPGPHRARSQDLLLQCLSDCL